MAKRYYLLSAFCRHYTGNFSYSEHIAFAHTVCPYGIAYYGREAHCAFRFRFPQGVFLRTHVDHYRSSAAVKMRAFHD
jgi:hypothetical protein